MLCAHSNVCSDAAGGGGSAATTTAAVAGGIATSGGATPTATGAAQLASTSKAAANMAFVVLVGGVMAAVLGLAAYLFTLMDIVRVSFGRLARILIDVAAVWLVFCFKPISCHANSWLMCYPIKTKYMVTSDFSL